MKDVFSPRSRSGHSYERASVSFAKQQISEAADLHEQIQLVVCVEVSRDDA